MIYIVPKVMTGFIVGISYHIFVAHMLFSFNRILLLLPNLYGIGKSAECFLCH